MKVYWQRWDILDESELSEPEYSGLRRSILKTNADVQNKTPENAHWFGEIEVDDSQIVNYPSRFDFCNKQDNKRMLAHAAAALCTQFSDIQLPCPQCEKMKGWVNIPFQPLGSDGQPTVESITLTLKNKVPSVCKHQPKDYIDVSLSPDGPWTRFRVQRTVELHHNLVEMPVIPSVEFELMEGEEPEEGVEFELVTELDMQNEIERLQSELAKVRCLLGLFTYNQS